MKKKLLSVLLASVMAISLVACGGGGKSKNDGSGDGELSGEITVWSGCGTGPSGGSGGKVPGEISGC